MKDNTFERRFYLEDKEIIELYFNRSQNAITETAKKYGKYCSYISYNILRNREDAEECANDTYLRAWNAIPPKSPECLSAYLGKITRNLSLNLLEKNGAKKRGSGNINDALDELGECISSPKSVESEIDNMLVTENINEFLSGLERETRIIFMRRYWYLSSIKEISSEYNITESKVKMSLFRTRNNLKQFLEKEGVTL